jgi:hypothetical protein
MWRQKIHLFLVIHLIQVDSITREELTWSSVQLSEANERASSKFASFLASFQSQILQFCF